MKFFKNRMVWIGALVVLILGGGYLAYRAYVRTQVAAVRKFERETQAITMLARPNLPVSLTAEQIRKVIPVLEALQPKAQIDAGMATQATTKLESLLTADQKKVTAALDNMQPGQRGQQLQELAGLFGGAFGGQGDQSGTGGQGAGGQRRSGAGGNGGASTGGAGGTGGGNYQGGGFTGGNFGTGMGGFGGGMGGFGGNFATGANGANGNNAQNPQRQLRQAQNARTIAGSTLTRVIQQLWNRLDQISAGTNSTTGGASTGQ